MPLGFLHLFLSRKAFRKVMLHPHILPQVPWVDPNKGPSVAWDESLPLVRIQIPFIDLAQILPSLRSFSCFIWIKILISSYLQFYTLHKLLFHFSLCCVTNIFKFVMLDIRKWEKSTLSCHHTIDTQQMFTKSYWWKAISIIEIKNRIFININSSYLHFKSVTLAITGSSISQKVLENYIALDKNINNYEYTQSLCITASK
jgi:hypothetical protein